MIKDSFMISGLVQSYLVLSKTKEALHAAREAMKAMPQSAKALKLVGDVHAINSGGREKVKLYISFQHQLRSKGLLSSRFQRL